MSRIERSGVKVGQVVGWRGANGRRYVGSVHRLVGERAVQVDSRDGFRWLLPVAELTVPTPLPNLTRAWGQRYVA